MLRHDSTVAGLAGEMFKQKPGKGQAENGGDMA